MRTVDVRLLVRGDHVVENVLEQLLSGALRVHAVAELVPDPRPGAPTYGRHVPVSPVHRARRSEHREDVATWRGELLRPRDDL